MTDELARREAAELARRAALDAARLSAELTTDLPSPVTSSLARPGASDEERLVEAALRPKSLVEFIGQERVREQLSLVLESAKRRGRPPLWMTSGDAPVRRRGRPPGSKNKPKDSTAAG